MPSEAIRSSLFAALRKCDPEEAARVGHESSLGRLLELVRSCQPLPADFVRLVRDRIAGVESTDPERDARAMSAWADWLAGNGLTGIDPSVDHKPRSVLPPQLSPTVLVETPPFPREWRSLVKETRARLLEPMPRPPFSPWILPQPLWRSSWVEAFAVISIDARATSAATVMVPTEDAADSREASEAWRARIAAGIRLSTNPVRARTGLLSRVFECAVASAPSYVIVERLTHGPRTLAERIRSADRPTPQQLVELAIALCQLLSTLAASQVRVMDLRPDLIAFEHSEGLRLTQLLDPTAVWPAIDLIPELRLGTTSLETVTSAADATERAQVFLVAALILGLLCNTTELLHAPVFRQGRSASLASLAGSPQLADDDPDRITAPLSAELRRTHPNRDDDMAIGHLVQTLRWALSEEPDERHQSLDALSADLRARSGS